MRRRKLATLGTLLKAVVPNAAELPWILPDGIEPFYVDWFGPPGGLVNRSTRLFEVDFVNRIIVTAEALCLVRGASTVPSRQRGARDSRRSQA